MDLSKKLPGRGAWLCAKQNCLRRALQKGAFARAFQDAVIVDETDVLTQVQSALTAAVKSQLGLAFRSGQLLAGREKVFAGLKAGDVSLVICSHDLSARTLKDVQLALEQYGNVPVLMGPDQIEAGGAIGRSGTGVFGLTGTAFSRPLAGALKNLMKWMSWLLPFDSKGELLNDDVAVLAASAEVAEDLIPQRSV